MTLRRGSEVVTRPLNVGQTNETWETYMYIIGRVVDAHQAESGSTSPVLTLGS